MRPCYLLPIPLRIDDLSATREFPSARKMKHICAPFSIRYLLPLLLLRSVISRWRRTSVSGTLRLSDYICIMRRGDIDRYQLQLNFTGYMGRTGQASASIFFPSQATPSRFSSLLVYTCMILLLSPARRRRRA